MEINRILTSNNAKSNFLKGLIRLAKSDNINDEKEIAYFQQAAISLGISKEEQYLLNELWSSNEKIVLNFENTEQKMFFFIQAIQLCWLDGEYVKKEQQEIRKIAQELNISEDSIEQVERWAYEGIQWSRKGDALLSLR